MIAWLKSKWQWLVIGLLVLLAFVAGKGLTKDEIQKALAFRKLKEVDDAYHDTAAKAVELDKQANVLATQLASEQVLLEAEKEKAHAATDDAVIDQLREHHLVK